MITKYVDPDAGQLPGPHSIAAMRLLCMAQVTWACFFSGQNQDVWITSSTFIVWGLRSRWPSNLDSWMTVYWSLLSSTTRQRQFPGNFRFCFSWVCKGSRCWISKANGRNVVEAFSQELPKEDSCTHDRHVNWFALSIWALYFKCWFSSVEKDTAKPKCWWEVLKIESVLWFGDLVCQTRAKRLKS